MDDESSWCWMQATIPPPLTYKISALPNELIQHDKSNNVVAMTEFHSDFIDARPAVVTRPLESCVRPSYDGKYPLRIIRFSRLSFA